MKPLKLFIMAATSALLFTTPAWALPSQAPSNHGTPSAPSGSTGNGSANPGTPNTSNATGNTGSAGSTGATGATGNPGGSHVPATPGPNASLPAKAKAYGSYCQTESKSHIAGQTGTPFSQCVTAMAKLANNTRTNPTSACITESKHHVAGQHGTPFSRCVSAAAKLLRSENSQQPTGSTGATGPTGSSNN